MSEQPTNSELRGEIQALAAKLDGAEIPEDFHRLNKADLLALRADFAAHAKAADPAEDTAEAKDGKTVNQATLERTSSSPRAPATNPLPVDGAFSPVEDGRPKPPPKPAPAQRFRFQVAKGVTINCGPRGLLKQGDEVRGDDFAEDAGEGQRLLRVHIDAGRVLERK